MSIDFYQNNFRCLNHSECGEGASCAIDVLLDIFYYCVFKGSSNVMNCHSGLLAKLIEACVEREITCETACTARHHVWDWLVENLPRSFEPKGRGDAEVLEGFKQVAREAESFRLTRLSATCNDCTYREFPEDKVIPTPMPIDPTVTQATHGFLPDSFVKALNQIRCSSCRSKNCQVAVTLPEFLTMEICVIDYKNRQNPPLLIPETFSPVSDVQYELVGAVLVRPGHFTCIVKYNSQFFLLDDLKDDCKAFHCFTGAITNDHRIMQDHHFTSPNEDGIHILLYACQKHANIGPVVINSSNGADACSLENLHDKTNMKKPVGSVSFPILKQASTNEKRGSTQGRENKEGSGSNGDVHVPKRKPKVKDEQQTDDKRQKHLQEIRTKKLVADITTRDQKKSYNTRSDSETSEFQSLKVLGKEFTCKQQNGKYYINCKEIFSYVGLDKHIKNRGFKHIDSKVEKAGLNVSEEFIFENNTEVHISERISRVYSG